LAQRRVQYGAHVDYGLRREARIELTLEQAANVVWAQGAKADVPDFRVHVVTDMEFVRFVGPRPNRRSDRFKPISEILGDGDPRVRDRYAAIMLCLCGGEQLGYLLTRSSEVAFTDALAIVPAQVQPRFPSTICSMMDAAFVATALA
jgi:hypothetical protein